MPGCQLLEIVLGVGQACGCRWDNTAAEGLVLMKWGLGVLTQISSRTESGFVNGSSLAWLDSIDQGATTSPQ